VLSVAAETAVAFPAALKKLRRSMSISEYLKGLVHRIFPPEYRCYLREQLRIQANREIQEEQVFDRIAADSGGKPTYRY
jgi:hypothetical protein